MEPDHETGVIASFLTFNWFHLQVQRICIHCAVNKSAEGPEKPRVGFVLDNFVVPPSCFIFWKYHNISLAQAKCCRLSQPALSDATTIVAVPCEMKWERVTCRPRTIVCLSSSRTTSDLCSVWHRRCLQGSSRREFRESGVADSRTLLTGVFLHEYLPALSVFIGRFGWNRLHKIRTQYRWTTWSFFFIAHA